MMRRTLLLRTRRCSCRCGCHRARSWRPWRPRGSRGEARTRVPSGYDARARRLVPGPGVSRAVDRRLPPHVVARSRRAPGSTREVSRRRHPQPHGTDAGDDRVAHQSDGRAEHPRAQQSERRIGRRPDAARHLHKMYAICESVHGVRKRAEPVSRRGAGYGRQAAAQLESDVKNGAIGFKIFKETGMDTTKADGTRLKINDPELAPIWETAARLNIPVIIHTAEPSGVLQAARYAQRALARARAVRQPPAIPRACLIRIAQRGTRRSVREASEDALHLGALRMARQRSRPRGEAARRSIRTSSSSWRRSSTTWAGSRAPRTTSSSSIRIGFCSARTLTRPRNFRTTGACSRRGTSTSTITATTTRSGRCMAWGCQMRCSERCITRTRGV